MRLRRLHWRGNRAEPRLAGSRDHLNPEERDGSATFLGGEPRRRHLLTRERDLWLVRTFDTIEELRAARSLSLLNRYNETWLVVRHGYRTPARVPVDQFGLIRTLRPT